MVSFVSEGECQRGAQSTPKQLQQRQASALHETLRAAALLTTQRT